MSYNVKPLKKYAEISYRVKCVHVENERVFGDVYVAQQTRDLVRWPDDYPLPSVYVTRRHNLIKRTLNGPNFMELNSERSTEDANLRWQKRSKSMGDQPNMIAFNYENVAHRRNATVKVPKVNVREINS